MNNKEKNQQVEVEEEEEAATAAAVLNRLFGLPVSVPVLPTMNNNNSNGGFYPSPRRFTTNPSSDSSFIQNPYPNPVSEEEALFFDHHPQSDQAAVSLEDALSRMRISEPSNESLSYRHHVDMFGNHPIINNDYYMSGGGGGGGGGQHGFNHIQSPTLPLAPIDYQQQQRIVGYAEDWIARYRCIMGTDYATAAAAFASQMNQVPPRRANTTTAGSVCLNEAYMRMMNAGVGGGGMISWCGCGNPLCSLPQFNPQQQQQIRRQSGQSALALAEQFRRGASSLTNANGYSHRQNYNTGVNGNGNINGNVNGNGNHHSRRGLSLERRFDLSRSTLNNRNRLELHQYVGVPLADLRRKIVALAQDQNGCRHLQTYFEEGKPDEIRIIFSEIKDYVGTLMMDPFGNYLVQKMFDVCTEDQLTQLIHSLTRDTYEFVQIAMDLHGNCCVQKLLQLITTPEQISLVMSALGPGAAMMTRETNGHHVLNLCLKSFNNDEIKYILKNVEDNCVDIATDKSGCCVLQQFLEHTEGEYRERLVTQITSHALLLAQDPFGNYVVQYLLQQRIHRITDDILRQLKGNFVSLSMQKCSSNVVQRCLNESIEERSLEIIRELIDSSKIVMLFQDQYANYVIQTALEVSRAREHIFNAVADLIRMNYQSLRSHPFGKRVISKMNELSRRNHI